MKLSDQAEGEVLTYRAFRDRETLAAWRQRQQAHERGAVESGAEDHERAGLWWIRSAGGWLSEQLTRTF